ncbi:MAG: hypothetical protein Q4Q53_01715 [Methanocorpusculum sp.]|nr:hypothetical protein [Methanocorpusculum sp.]
MKKIAAAVSIILLITVSAGCINGLDGLNDPIIGTWVSGEYTNLAGTHYTKMVETFCLNHTISESLYTSDDEFVRMSAVWENKGNNIYHSYYAPIILNYHPSDNHAVINSDLFLADDIILEHADSSKGIIGKWKTTYPREIKNDVRYLNFELFQDGKGTVEYLKEDKTIEGSSIVSWLKMDENSYAIVVSNSVVWEIKADGNLYDNFGCVYTKER